MKQPMNTPRQPSTAMKPCPISGAMAGTIMNTIMMKLVIRAISRPEYRSRTSAVPTIRGEAAPSPCAKRASSSSSSEWANIATIEKTR